MENVLPKVLVDADGCPVIDETIKVAKQFGLQVLLFCDTSHAIDRPEAETIYCLQRGGCGGL